MNRSVYIGYANTQNKTREFEGKNPVDKIHVIQTVYSFNAKSEIKENIFYTVESIQRPQNQTPTRYHLTSHIQHFWGVLSIYMAI